MSVTIVKRPPRVPPPTVPSEEIVLQPPPELPRMGDRGSWLMNALPMVGGLASVGVMFTGQRNVALYAMSGLMLMSTIGYIVIAFVRQRQQRTEKMVDVRRDYLRYLSQTRKHVRRVAARQREAQLFIHPDPDQLWSVVSASDRLWERRPADPDFAQVRVGLGDQLLATPLRAPETAPLDELEPVSAEALRRFLRTHGTLEELPMAISLRAFHRVFVVGEPDQARGQVRAMLAQLMTFHSPEDLQIAICTNSRNLNEWDWVKWLPHAQHPKLTDATGPVRMVSENLEQIEHWLPDLSNRPRFTRDAQPLFDQPHLVVVIDEGYVPVDCLLASYDGLLGVTVIEVNPTNYEDLPRGGLRITTQDGKTYLEAASGAAYQGRGDWLSLPQAESLARQLAPLRLSNAADDEPLLANLSFTDLMGLNDAADVNPAKQWRRLAPHEKLRVPIGVGETGEPVELDLKEASLNGMGPHGLCIGATGSGKSELLRTLVLALAITHSSEILNFVLTDFKGGATFQGMEDMPHVAAVITNLADDLTMVDRMQDAISGEILRRQTVLNQAGYKNIHDYERARETGTALEPLPSLLIIVDEFSELLTAKPDFIDMFLQIGRVGRSLGVHLLLASQRLESGKIRGLEAFLSYRIGLKTFNAAESREVLGVPDAYTLPPVPGSGYLKSDTENLVRFKAAYVSGPYKPSGGASPEQRVDSTRKPVLFSTTYVPLQEEQQQAQIAVAQPETAKTQEKTVLQVIVERLKGQGPPAHQVWLPPLKEPPTLDKLLGELQVTPDRGLQAVHLPLGRLAAPIGIKDNPANQSRDPLWINMTRGSEGHALIVGGPQSGKSTLLRTVICALALTHTPQEVQFYCLDFGGGALMTLQSLPHVGAVAGRLDAELVRRVLSEMLAIIEKREQLFVQHQIDSIETFRQKRANGEIEDPYGDVFLVVDGWLTLKQDFELLEQEIVEIASRGLSFGVHVVIAANRWAEIKPALKDQIGTRLELRLGDPMESDVDRKIAANVPNGAPGRGLAPDKLHFLAAVPRIDGQETDLGLADGVAHLVQAVTQAWQDRPAAPRVRTLPLMLPFKELPVAGQDTERGVPIGIDETRLAPVYLDFDADPHFIVFGDSEAGKTNFLRMLARGITDRYPPDKARLLVVDYRHTLLNQVNPEHLLYYAPAAPGVQAMVNDLKTALTKRIPGPDVTPEQVRDRSWWSGPDVFIIVDDYDLVVTSSGNPLAPLVEFLPLARDVGLHVILARRTGGAGRAMFEPMLQRLKDLGTPGLLLSGAREEGALLGNVKPSPQPPGRGVLVTRKRGAQLVQTAYLPAPR
ncbi:secretion protein EccC [Carbonactinospora thermoautotrophica]|uniref:Putative ATP/GTP binding protein (Putative membrane protein) n=1 Tax=Carbonactinospora thermoautotrophica TaxID=1469144 RepID=A0A132MPB8_9ACTN|nr:type VII secretion protein EccCa [Carbonactinospora thermoautotrophica]KWW99716.1 putative ATP/GTP binding protein (putative membrane protein) [Carbonactinospora thermoautotrophica]KWX04515.1 secretion protein EccC [Carbonactinospora thermoautotrophica]KWX09205.1 secretion protein EccC [Carbonactinospora thermoautotrophica]